MVSRGELNTKKKQLNIDKKKWEDKYLNLLNDLDKKHNNIINNCSVKSKKTIYDLNIACIFDEFTMECFKPESNLITFTPDNWKEILTKKKPDMLIVESAWQGNDGTWTRKVARYSQDERKEIFDLIKFCNDNNIPTIFWNKEDPVHFNAFIDTAVFFDYIFTTDADSVKKYKKISNNDNIYPMPFAAQPKIHNPIEIYKRKEKICFAGSYYATKYEERKRDLSMLFDESIKYGLDIFDRHYNDDLEQFMFPEEYQNYIRGNLKATEIQKAYKGYNVSINVNSVKYSPTMFSRRVFELLASNTPVISSYSKGIKNIFGGLVISSDDFEIIETGLSKLFNDKLYYEKYRLLGLREVLRHHTYNERLKYICNIIGINIIDDNDKISVIFVPQNQEELDKMIKQYEKQTYSIKELVILLNPDVDFNKTSNKDIRYYNLREKTNNKILDIIEGDYVAFFNSNDFYGENYLQDLILATQYTDCPIIGKAAYYSYQNDDIQLNNSENEYKFVKKLEYYNSLIDVDIIKNQNINEIISLLNDNFDLSKYVNDSHCMFSIDKFNYFKGFEKLNDKQKNEGLKKVEDIKGLNINYKINNFNEKENIREIEVSKNNINISLNKDKWLKKPSSIVKISNDKNSLLLNIEENKENNFEYIKYEQIKSFEVAPKESAFEFNKNKAYLVEILGASNKVYAQLFILGYAEDKKIQVESFNLNREKIFIPKSNVDKIRLAIRLSGDGICKINKIMLTPISDKDNMIDNITIEKLDGKEKYLVLTNIYPSDTDLYRNGFVHSRVRAYQEKGLDVDVFSFNLNNKNFEKYIFENVNVYKGNKKHLISFLKKTNYRKILIHFVNRDMIEAIDEGAPNIPLVIWVHGFESEKWWRRWFNFEINKHLFKKLRNAIKASNKRIEFMQELYSRNDKDIEFIFVSEYKKGTAEKDAKTNVSRYSIIPNIIDEEIFKYTEKDSEKRKKILSIRPYTARNYANDLAVKAILELSKEEFFNDLEFTFYGKGRLFDKTLEPLRKFSNVHIHKSFLTHHQIAKLHREHGIFLCPTRLDSQGVSIGEAMSSGLVPITNGVTAIPEFVDEKCGILAPKNSYKGLAEGIKELYYNSDKYLEMHNNASSKSQNQCGKNIVIPKEIEVIER
ncbi:glycosyltransferase [Tepidibacter mesophilus]|uniref:glycosyltransferase n=1 Tax=Tepidibacter mesophilus TaxID=655607 RepID=UPI000C085C4D|nr:glycosyltransferase [Tepidibacter mesophilus]